jgi:hypothetical protein
MQVLLNLTKNSQRALDVVERKAIEVSVRIAIGRSPENARRG